MTSWSPPAPISEAEVLRLGARMGCNFSSPSRRAYLDRWDSCDVQAAPGSGKTTLLVAKLAHLVSNWPLAKQGICVLSHTNIARHEIQERLAGIPETTRLLVHPNFVGTLTTFFHKFLALPLLRGLGWPVACIDDELFAERILLLAQTKRTVRGMLRMEKTQRQMRAWLSKLSIADDFSISEASPTRIKVAAQERMPNPGTRSRNELEELKAALISKGIYRYADMLVLARRAVQLSPVLARRIASRFPLVFIDEAQDTSTTHLELIDKLFGDGHSSLQRIGDCNQGILGGDGLDGPSWTPAASHVDLGESLRLGSAIARFASTITCHRSQIIEGKGSHHDWPLHVMLVNSGSEPAVGRHFAQLVASKFDESRTLDAWAVGWIHKSSESERALRLGTYFPSYKQPGRSAAEGKTMLGVLQVELARPAAADALDLAELVEAYGRQLRLLLAVHVPCKDLPSSRLLWRWLDEKRPGASRQLRLLLVRVVTSRGRIPPADWATLTEQLRETLDPALPRGLSSPALDLLLAHSDKEEPDSESNGADDERSELHAVDGRSIRVRLGTIASVKGRTHDATLIVQTTDGAVKDLCSALEVATGKLEVSGRPKIRRAVMNIFVAATRPRHLLCLALTKDSRSEKLRKGLEALGMIVMEVP